MHVFTYHIFELLEYSLTINKHSTRHRKFVKVNTVITYIVL